MITININKAKEIAHDIRRASRSEEFKPLDELIMKQIPNTDITLVESQRQSIRDKYSVIQSNIDSAETTQQIKEALNDNQ